MGKTGKVLLFAGGGIIALFILIMILRLLSGSTIRTQIPELSNYHTLSQAVQDQISEAINEAQSAPSSDNLGLLGMVYHSSANYPEAALCYQLAAEKSKSDWTWNYYLGYLNKEMGNSRVVIGNYKKVVEKNPELDLVWYYLGEEYNNIRNTELAEASFGRIAASVSQVAYAKGTTRVDHFPLGTYAKYQLSRIYLESGRLDLAEKTLKQIIQVNRTFGPAYRLLGNLYSKTGQDQLSNRYGVRANDHVAFSPPVDTLIDKLVLLSRSELYLLKKIDEAERSIYDQWTLRLVTHALDYLPDNKYLVSKAIKVHLWMGLHQEAISFIDKHMSFYPGNFTEMNNIGILFFRNGLYPQSVGYLLKALEMEPEHVESQIRLALCSWFMGDKQKANGILNNILEKNQNDADVVADVANLFYFNFREIEKAKGLIPKLRQLSPQNPKLLKLFAGIAEKEGDIQKAISLYQSSCRGAPEELTTFKFVGSLMVKHLMWEESILHFREALEFHPNDPYFLEKLGTLLIMCPDVKLLNIEEGIRYLERAFIHKSSRPHTLISAGKSLAIACEQRGDKRNAITTIKQTIEIGQFERISASQMEELQRLHQRFQAMEN